MEVTFLEAEMPLAKSFSLANGQLQKTPYPHAFRFTSHSYVVNSIQQLYDLYIEHAAQGHCILKGNVSRPLIKESRKGSTDASAPTSLLFWDLDRIRSFDSVERFMGRLPSEVKNASYIVQYSASMGITGPELSAHIAQILARPVHPATLKQWFTRLNLDIPELAQDISLTRTHNALRWPLDITVGQNDKLIYIAPPKLGRGIKDPFEGQERIVFVKKRYATVKYDFTKFNPGPLRSDVLKKLNTLRREQGLGIKKQINEKPYKDTTVATATDQSEITGIKSERGFTYLNLNGGDSWGYYHPDGNPDIIYNFKGEPNYKGKELLPNYYAELTAANSNEPRPQNPETAEPGFIYFAFIDKRSDIYYRGKYCDENEHLEIYETARRGHITDYLKQHAQPIPDYLELWDVEFAFDDPYRIDFEAKAVNTFEPSPIMKAKPRQTTTLPPTIDRVIFHALGGDKASHKAFLNWLGTIFQKRVKTGIAWVLHGTQGTGKGLLYNHILAPILGNPAYTPRVSMDILASENFNGFLEQAVFCLIDEAQISEVKGTRKLAGKLKEYITEPTLMIRKMRTNGYKAVSYTNFIIASNENDPVLINSDDRRYSVAARQTEKLHITNRDIRRIDDELEDFYGYLMHMAIDEEAARVPFDSPERQRIQALSRDSNEEVALRIATGDFDFFFDNKPGMELQMELTDRSRRELPTYGAVLERLYARLGRVNIDRDDLQTLFFYTTGNSFDTPHKFAKFLGYKGLEVAPIKVDEETTRGVKTRTWHASDEIKQAYLKWKAKSVEHNLKPVPKTKPRVRKRKEEE